MSKKFRHSGLILWIVLLLLFSSYSMVSSAEVEIGRASCRERV